MLQVWQLSEEGNRKETPIHWFLLYEWEDKAKVNKSSNRDRETFASEIIWQTIENEQAKGL